MLLAAAAASESRVLEAVHQRGERYEVPESRDAENRAAAFARWAGVKETSGNFARVLDPAHADHQFCESWQGVHNVCFLEKTLSSGVV